MLVKENWYNNLKSQKSQVLYERLSKLYTKNNNFNSLNEAVSSEQVLGKIKAIAQSADPFERRAADLIASLEEMLTQPGTPREIVGEYNKLYQYLTLNKNQKARALWVMKFEEILDNPNAGAGAIKKAISEPESVLGKTAETPAPRPEEPSPAPGKSPEGTKPKPNVEQQMNQVDEFFQKRGITGVGEVLDEVNPETIIPELAKQKTEQGFISQLRSSLSERIMSRKDTIDIIAKEIVDLLKGEFPLTLPSSRGYVKQLLLFLASIKIRSFLLANGNITTDKQGNKFFVVVDKEGNKKLIPADWTLDIIQYFINPLGAIAYGTKDFLLIPLYDWVLSVIGKSDSQASAVVKGARQAEEARPQPPATGGPAAPLTWQTAPDGSTAKFVYQGSKWYVYKENGSWYYKKDKSIMDAADLKGITEIVPPK